MTVIDNDVDESRRSQLPQLLGDGLFVTDGGWKPS